MTRPRNKRKKYRPELYEVKFLQEVDPPLDAKDCQYIISEGAVLECAIDRYLVISIPATSTRETARQIQINLSSKLNRSVLVIGHNIKFVELRKMTPDQAKQVRQQTHVGDMEKNDV